jgi:hypothetical protein
MAHRRASCGAALVVATLASAARADPPVPDDAAVSARLAWIEGVLEREEASMRLWRGSWLAIYGGVVIADVALTTNATSAQDRVGPAVDGAKAAVGFAFTLLSPATAVKATALLGEQPGDTPAARLARLRRAEGLLSTIAGEERDGRGWFPLLGGAALNVGGAWLTWAAYRGSGFAGWFGLLSGFAVGTVQVFTQPIGAIRAQAAYRRAGYLARPVMRDPGPALSVVAAPNGMGLRATF